MLSLVKHAGMLARRTQAKARHSIGKLNRKLDHNIGWSVSVLLIVAVCNALAFLSIKKDWASSLGLLNVSNWVLSPVWHLGVVLCVGPGITLLKKGLNLLEIQDDHKLADLYWQSVAGLKRCAAEVVKRYENYDPSTTLLTQRKRTGIQV